MDLRWYRYQQVALSPPLGGPFIHDFVRVDLPYDAVVGAFTYFVSPELIGMLVVDAWKAELAEAGRVLNAADSSADDLSVEAHLGPVRSRREALVVPISWQADSNTWIPSLNADLEIASFGPDRTHLHVMGLSDLAPGSVPCTERASLDHRLTVALVRHLLVSLAELLAEPLAEVDPVPEH